MKWHIEIPKTFEEDDRIWVDVEAVTIEEAVAKATPALYGRNRFTVGDKFLVSTKVEVIVQRNPPLQSY